MRTIVHALLLSLSFVACAEDDRALWHADKSFSEIERKAIVEGETWIAMSAGHEPGGVAFDYSPSGEQPLPHTIRRERRGVTGLCLDGAIFVDADNALNKDLPGLVAHEIAHCRFGFVDGYRAEDVTTDGIMRVLSPMRWTDREEEQCERTHCRDQDR